MIKYLWLVAILAIRSELWMTRNKITYVGAKANWYKLRQRVFQLIHDNSRRMNGYMHNTVEDLKVLNYFRVAHRKTKVITPVECLLNAFGCHKIEMSYFFDVMELRVAILVMH